MLVKKKILYIDLDGVVANFDKRLKEYCPNIDSIVDDEERSAMVDKVCEINNKIFDELEPMPDAIESVKLLSDYFDVYFLSTPMWGVPNSFTHKRLWVERYFGKLATKRLILSHRKDLNIGAYLIDDRLKNGAGEFMGAHIHFGTERFPNWKSVLQHLLN